MSATKKRSLDSEPKSSSAPVLPPVYPGSRLQELQKSLKHVENPGPIQMHVLRVMLDLPKWSDQKIRDRLPHRLRNLPGPLPATLSRMRLSEIRSGDYLVSEKSDGVRKILFIFERKMFLIDRRWKIDEILNVSSPSSSTTLLDGELVDSEFDEKPTFLAYDAAMVEGQYIGKRTLIERLNAINELIPRLNNEIFRVQSKLFVHKREILRVVQKLHANIAMGTRKSPKHYFVDIGRKRINLNDGIVFTRNNDEFIPKQENSLLKWKWMDKITVDFKIKAPFIQRNRAGKKYMVLYGGGGKGVDVEMKKNPAPVHVEKWVENTLEARGVRECVVECMYFPTEGRWKILLIREDKKEANYMTTIMETLESMIDNVTRDDLVRAALGRD